MKILHCVESYYPSVGGMQEVVKQLSERLVKMGHEVTVATSNHPDRNVSTHNGVNIIGFSISGNLVNGIKGEREKYEQFLLTNQFEVITFFAAQQWATDLALPLLGKIKAAKVSVPTGYSGFYLKEYAGYFESMKTWIKDYDMNVYLSNHYRDIDFARDNGVSKITLIPNGAGEDEFLKPNAINVRKQLGLSDTDFLILHVGSFTGKKGQDEAIRILLNSNLKNATLLLIGNNYEDFKFNFQKNYRLFAGRLRSRLRGNKIIIGYYNRQFTVEAYKQADLFLFPSNIECSPIVLFECAAAKTPFLASNVGNSEEIAAWTGGGIVLPTDFDSERESHVRVGESAKILDDLAANTDLRRQMADRAFKQWEQKYSWQQISKDYETLYLNLINKHGHY